MKQKVSFAMVTLLASACAAAPNDDLPDSSGGDELTYMKAHGYVGKVADTASSVAKSITWTVVNTHNGANNPTGFTPATHMCVLSSVWGSLKDADRVDVYAVDQWYADHWANAAGQGICVPWLNFSAPANSVFWASYDQQAYRGSSGTSTAAVWWGDSITTVSGVEGHFQGAGESVHISQSSNPFGASVLSVVTQAGNDTFIDGSANSMFVGVPNAGRLVKLIGYNASSGTWVRGDMTSSLLLYFIVGEAGGYSSYYLPPTNSAVCYLGRVSGDFNGSGDKVAIYQNGSGWFINHWGHAIGYARCMAYNQN